MDYSQLSLVQLKKIAKEHIPKIKQYYVKSKAELIAILSMPEFTREMILDKMTISKLREEAENNGHMRVWSMRRDELVALLNTSPEKNDKDNDHTEKHDNPQESESEEVRV
jgi:hypothetical protein